MLNHDLGRAENVPGGREPDGDAIDLDRLAIFEGLRGFGEIGAIAAGHDGERIGMGEHFAMAAARMV